MSRVALIAAALGLAAGGTAVAAKDVAVSYADLDLSSPAGQKKLERRIADAIEEVCMTNQTLTGTRVRSNASIQCAREAKAQAKQQVAAIVERQGLGG